MPTKAYMDVFTASGDLDNGVNIRRIHKLQMQVFMKRLMMHQDFLQQAIDLARENVAEGGGPFGALIVKNRRIVAASGNRVSANLDPTAHAEIMAIRAACIILGHFELKECTLYTSCEPCPMCLGAIYWARLADVYYACKRADAAAAGFDDSFIYDEIPKQADKRTIPMHAIEIGSANLPFTHWANLENRIRY